MDLGYPELIVLLVMLLLLFGGRNLPELIRGIAEGIRSFQNSNSDQWRRRSRQNHENDGDTNWMLIVFLLSLIGIPILMSLTDSKALTGKQALMLVAVLGLWLTVGYLCFGRRDRNE